MRRFLMQGVVVGYLLVTLAAFVFTMTRIRIPLIPWPLVHWSYGMMAPFQGYTRISKELVVKGIRSDGTPEQVDLAPYSPFFYGEANIRTYFPPFIDEPAELQRRYRFMAERLLALEREQGHGFDQLRLSFELWPASPAGYEFLRQESFVSREDILTVP